MEFRQVTCPICFTKFVTGSQRRVFCSRKCYRKYYSRRSWERYIADPEVKERELLRLKAWKEAHRKPKQEKVGWFDITII
jgi:endogenous inhibitor of DNA gyrase (YacG/DUF329 family)